MTEVKQNLLQHFKAKKAEKDSEALREARRLVNLYRSLSCFGDDFLNKYNQMLLDIKPSVRRLLHTFMGGDEVEDYLEFLQENVNLTNAEVEQKNNQEISQSKGYLPSPDLDFGISSTEDMITISKAEWEKIKEREESLQKQLKNVSNSEKKIPVFKESKSLDNYSEIIEAEGQNNE